MKKNDKWDKLSEPKKKLYVNRALYLINAGYVEISDEYELAKNIYETKYKK